MLANVFTQKVSRHKFPDFQQLSFSKMLAVQRKNELPATMLYLVLAITIFRAAANYISRHAGNYFIFQNDINHIFQPPDFQNPQNSLISWLGARNVIVAASGVFVHAGFQIS